MENFDYTAFSDDRPAAQIKQVSEEMVFLPHPSMGRSMIEEQTANSPPGNQGGLVLPYLFGDSMLVNSALQLLQLCSNGSKLCCSHCLTQDLPTVSATNKSGSI